MSSLRDQDIDGFARAAKSASDFETLAEQGIKMAMKGLTTVEEVMRISGGVDA